jgi:hypothetical protein
VSDVLIRNVPDDVIAAIDAHAQTLGLSRNEYLRRRLEQEIKLGARPVTMKDLEDFEERFADLADPEVMRQAWS